MEKRKKRRIRHLTDLYYDMQEARKAAASRLREISDNLDDAMDDNEIRSEDYTELGHALDEYIEDNLNPKHLESLEEEIKRRLERELEDVEIYTDFLSEIKGISTTLGAGLVSRLIPEEAPHVSSFWKFCGMDPEGAKGRTKGEKIDYNPWMKDHVWKIGDSFIKQRTPKYRDIYDRTKVEENEKLNHVVEVYKIGEDGVEDITKEPEGPYTVHYEDDEKELPNNMNWPRKVTHTGETLDEIEKLRVTKPKRCPEYDECVEDIKEKAERANREPKKPTCIGHVDKRARRKMVKEFLKDLWVEWRKIEGLPVGKTYHEAIQDSKSSKKESRK